MPQFYDYDKAMKAGLRPDSSGHWPSEVKPKGHPAEFVGGFSTRTKQRQPGTRVLGPQGLVDNGWDPETARELSPVASHKQTRPLVTTRRPRRNVARSCGSR